jgi:hypothetical protein
MEGATIFEVIIMDKFFGTERKGSATLHKDRLPELTTTFIYTEQDAEDYR